MGWFSKKTEEKLIEDQEAKRKRERKEQFMKQLPAKALFGKKCRTCKLVDKDLGDVYGVYWLEAVEVRGHNGTWHVVKMTEKEKPGHEKPVREVKPIKEFTTFPEMALAMADFEQGEMARGNTPIEEKQDIADTDHYETMLEKEGIVFDVDGMPHPTMRNSLVTKGTFTQEAIEGIGKQIDGLDLREVFAKASSGALLMTATPENLEISYDNLEGLELVSTINALFEQAMKGCQRRVDYASCINDKFRYFNKFQKSHDKTDRDFYIVCVGAPLYLAKPLLDRLATDEKMAPARRFYAECALGVGVLLEKEAKDALKQDASLHPTTFKQTRKYIERAMKDIETYGGSALHAKQLRELWREKEPTEICAILLDTVERKNGEIRYALERARLDKTVLESGEKNKRIEHKPTGGGIHVFI